MAVTNKSVMKTVLSTIKYLAIFVLFCSPALAQSPAIKAQIFAKDGLSFEYAEGWKLIDKSTSEAQHLILTHEGSSALIMIIAFRDLIGLPEQLTAARSKITEPFIEDTSRKLGVGASHVERENGQIQVGDEIADGVRIRGMLNNEKATAEVYSFLSNLRFVNLVYIRSDKDSPLGDPVWEAIRKLKVDTPIIGTKEDGGRGQEFPDQVLNGKALRLPAPDYPIPVRRANIWGIVTVQVIIDENGNVMEARAISGPVQLRGVAVKAARAAKFSPTKIYGNPVKVTGVITYNFEWAPL